MSFSSGGGFSQERTRIVRQQNYEALFCVRLSPVLCRRHRGLSAPQLSLVRRGAIMPQTSNRDDSSSSSPPSTLLTLLFLNSSCRQRLKWLLRLRKVSHSFHSLEFRKIRQMIGGGIRRPARHSRHEPTQAARGSIDWPPFPLLWPLLLVNKLYLVHKSFVFFEVGKMPNHPVMVSAAIVVVSIAAVSSPSSTNFWHDF